MCYCLERGAIYALRILVVEVIKLWNSIELKRRATAILDSIILFCWVGSAKFTRRFLLFLLIIFFTRDSCDGVESQAFVVLKDCLIDNDFVDFIEFGPFAMFWEVS